MAGEFAQKAKAAGCLLGMLILLVVGLLNECVNFGSGPTDSTIYYIDQDHVYYSPPLLAADSRAFAFSVFADDAIAQGFSPLDEKIADATDYEAVVYVNPNTGKWVLESDPRGHKFLWAITWKELRETKDRKADHDHVVMGGFQDCCGLFEWLVRKVGLLQPRWSDNGGWNW